MCNRAIYLDWKSARGIMGSLALPRLPLAPIPKQLSLNLLANLDYQGRSAYESCYYPGLQVVDSKGTAWTSM